MSQQQINRSSDLSRLQAEGYNVRVEDGHLVMYDVPYVTAQRELKTCVLADPYNDASGQPANHTMWMSGELPCDENGIALERIFAGAVHQHNQPVAGLTFQWQFSVKMVGDAGQYIPDTEYYSKFVRYVERLGRHVKALGSDLTALTHPVVSPDADEDSVFRYIDTASIRARIVPISRKLELQRVAIVGVGGTGSYILDLVAKTPVREVHLYDPDVFHQHNAFRSPGASSVEILKAKPKKVDYFAAVYGNMRTGIVPHPDGITEGNVNELAGMNFVFLALDAGEPKRRAIETLQAATIPFVDCGMGVYEVEEKLAGVARVTTGTPAKYDHIAARVSFSDGNANNEYSQNIQIADLNALNASLAVIRWKKHCGFYNDLEQEHHSTYTVDGNILSNEDLP
jgi:hypothetical protein